MRLMQPERAGGHSYTGLWVKGPVAARRFEHMYTGLFMCDTGAGIKKYGVKDVKELYRVGSFGQSLSKTGKTPEDYVLDKRGHSGGS